MTKEELKFFNDIAPKWDSMEVKSTPAKVDEILSLIGVNPGDHIADIGCGTGVLLPRLSTLTGESGIVEGVDFSDGMLREAEKKCRNLKNVKFQKIDIEEDVLDGKFDLIIMYCVYPHFSEPELTLKILSGLNLNRGGRIVIAFPCDERFINNIHHSREIEDGLDSDLLPSAPKLARRITGWGLPTEIIAYSSEMYIIEITPSD